MDPLLTFNNSLQPILNLIFAFAGLIGAVFVGTGLVRVANSGKNRGEHSHGSLLGLTLILTGALLTTVAADGSINHLVMHSILGQSENPESVISPITGADPAKNWVRAVFNILVVLGWLAVVRGIMILGMAGSRREKGLGSGITHIVTGMLLSNPVGFAQMIGFTFGQQELVSLFLPP